LVKTAQYPVQPTRMQRFAVIAVCARCPRVWGSATARTASSASLAATLAPDLVVRSVVVMASANSKVVLLHANATRIMQEQPVPMHAQKIKMARFAMEMESACSKITRPSVFAMLGTLARIVIGVCVLLPIPFSTRKPLGVHANQVTHAAVGRSKRKCN